MIVVNGFENKMFEFFFWSTAPIVVVAFSINDSAETLASEYISFSVVIVVWRWRKWPNHYYLYMQRKLRVSIGAAKAHHSCSLSVHVSCSWLSDVCTIVLHSKRFLRSSTTTMGRKAKVFLSKNLRDSLKHQSSVVK